MRFIRIRSLKSRCPSVHSRKERLPHRSHSFLKFWEALVIQYIGLTLSTRSSSREMLFHWKQLFLYKFRFLGILVSASGNPESSTLDCPLFTKHSGLRFYLKLWTHLFLFQISESPIASRHKKPFGLYFQFIFVSYEQGHGEDISRHPVNAGSQNPHAYFHACSVLPKIVNDKPSAAKRSLVML